MIDELRVRVGHVQKYRSLIECAMFKNPNSCGPWCHRYAATLLPLVHPGLALRASAGAIQGATANAATPLALIHPGLALRASAGAIQGATANAATPLALIHAGLALRASAGAIQGATASAALSKLVSPQTPHSSRQLMLSPLANHEPNPYPFAA